MPEPLTFDDLFRFHREIVLPDIERVVDSRLDRTNDRIEALRNEMVTCFDGVYLRLERLRAGRLEEGELER